MFRKFFAATLAVVLAVGSVFAEEIKGIFVKADDKTVTIKEGDKEKTYNFSDKEIKVKGKDGTEKSVKLGDFVSKRYKADQKVTLTVEKDVVVGIKGEGKKKKD